MVLVIVISVTGDTVVNHLGQIVSQGAQGDNYVGDKKVGSLISQKETVDKDTLPPKNPDTKVCLSLQKTDQDGDSDLIDKNPS